MSASERRAAALAAAVARTLLLLYPAGFRRDAGDELVEDFRLRAAERARGGGALRAGLWLCRGTLSLLANAPGAWRERRGAGREPLGTLGREGRVAARRLVRAPGFTSVVVATLALGIGGTSAVFSVVRAVLVEPLPYERPDQLVRLYQFDEEEPATDLYVSAPHFLAYREQASAFQNLVAIYTYEETGADLLLGDRSERVRLLRVSSGYLRLLRAEPLAGRAFTREEEHGTPVALLSERLADRLGEEPARPGGSVELDGRRYTVVGVVPPELADPVAGEVDVWIPLDLHSGGAQFPGNHYLSVLGRLAEGATAEAAREEMAALDLALGRRWPDVADDGGFHLAALHADLVGEARPILLLLLGAVGVVLLIACVNVANLQTVRTLARRRELAVRSALGGGRGALARQLLIESLLLATLGGVLGVAVAVAGVDVLVALGGDAVPRAGAVAVDRAVLAFTAVVTLLAGVAFGLAPAFALSRTSPAATLRDATAGSAGSPRYARVRSALVAGQVALSLVLLVGASVLATSLHRLTRVELGFEPDEVLTFELNLPPGRYRTGGAGVVPPRDDRAARSASRRGRRRRDLVAPGHRARLLVGDPPAHGPEDRRRRGAPGGGPADRGGELLRGARRSAAPRPALRRPGRTGRAARRRGEPGGGGAALPGRLPPRPPHPDGGRGAGRRGGRGRGGRSSRRLDRAHRLPQPPPVRGSAVDAHLSRGRPRGGNGGAAGGATGGRRGRPAPRRPPAPHAE